LEEKQQAKIFEVEKGQDLPAYPEAGCISIESEIQNQCIHHVGALKNRRVGLPVDFIQKKPPPKCRVGRSLNLGFKVGTF
jgi:hypothetical protein